MTPTFRAIVEAAQDALLAMHRQEWGGEVAVDMSETSPYMRTLVRHITHCRRAGGRGGLAFEVHAAVAARLGSARVVHRQRC